MMALDDYFTSPGVHVLLKLYDSLNSIDMAGVPRSTPIEKALMRRGVTGRNVGDACAVYTPQVSSSSSSSSSSSGGGGMRTRTRRGGASYCICYFESCIFSSW